METVSIRNLRGSFLRECAGRGELLSITNHRLVIGVLIPVATAWVEHLIDYNWSHVGQSIAEGERAITDGSPLVTLDDAVAAAEAEAEADAVRFTQSPQNAPVGAPERLAVPLVAAAVSGTVTQAPESLDILERIRAALTPPVASGQGTGPPEPSVCTVRIGDLSARAIEQAGDAGQTLAITHDRELIGILIPVTRGLVQFLMEQNISRVLYNIGMGEKELGTPDKLTTLGEVSGTPPPPTMPGDGHSPSPAAARRSLLPPGS